MFSSSAFKVSFLTIYTTSPFEIIFGERRDTETQFSNSLAYNCSTSFYFIFRKPYRCPKSTHRLIHLFPTDLKCKYYHKLNLHLYLYVFFFTQFRSINLPLYSCVRYCAEQFIFIISLSYSNFMFYVSRLTPPHTYSAFSGLF